MKNAELLLLESMRRRALAACNVTGSGHAMAIYKGSHRTNEKARAFGEDVRWT